MLGGGRYTAGRTAIDRNGIYTVDAERMNEDAKNLDRRAYSTREKAGFGQKQYTSFVATGPLQFLETVVLAPLVEPYYYSF